MKRTRLFWSYRIDNTERWLSQMAQDGNHVRNLNPLSRTFTFQKGPSSETSYAIQYNDKELTSGLRSSGWKKAASSGKWRILQNDSKNARTIPLRNSILKRTRFHAYLFLALATILLSLQLPLIVMMGIGLSVSGERFIWTPLLIPFILFVFLGGLAIYVFRAYRKFEVSEMGAVVDEVTSGEKTRKLRPGWMYQPFQTKKWLESLAAEGLILESVSTLFFTFTKTEPQQISYEVNFESKVNTDFYSFHKENGWQLKFASNLSWLNYSIWAMPYKAGEKVPAFIYDPEEKARHMRKAFRMNIGIAALIVLMTIQSIYINTVSSPSPFFEWSFIGFIRSLLILSMTLWIYLIIKIIASYRKEMKLPHL